MDVRINDNGTIRINGITVQESAVHSHIQALWLSKQTKVRLVFSERAYTGVVNKVIREFHKTNIGVTLSTTMLSQDDYRRYAEDQIRIDVLSDSKILFNGTKIFADDLKIALQNSRDKTAPVHVVPSDVATFGAVYDVQKVIAQTGFDTPLPEQVLK